MHNRPRSPIFPLAPALTLALTLAGCSGGTVDESGQGAAEVGSPTYAPAKEGAQESTEGPEPAHEEVDPAPGGDNREALLTAIETALTSVEGSKVYAVESESGGTVWEVEVVDPAGARYEIDVSSDGSRVLAGSEAKSGEPKHLERVNGASADLADVLDAAVKHIPGVVIELELDTDDGLLVWEVEVVDNDGHSTDFDIDATTADVVR